MKVYKKNPYPDPQNLNPEAFRLNTNQWDFIYKYYPEYAKSPFQLMKYLFQQSFEYEQGIISNAPKELSSDTDEEDLNLEVNFEGLSDQNHSSQKQLMNNDNLQGEKLRDLEAVKERLIKVPEEKKIQEQQEKLTNFYVQHEQRLKQE